MFKLFTVALLLCSAYCGVAAGQPNSDSDCQPITAERGTPLVLNGCHRSPRRWFHLTGGAREEILRGIDVVTGSLEVTASASSEVGGQQYECLCGDEPRCYIIHVPPLMDVTFTPRNVTVGGSVSVTCSATEGFPIPENISLISPHHVMTVVENGHPHVLHNVQLEDGGTYTCELDGVIYAAQPSTSGLLNVYTLSVENATVPVNEGTTATIGCLVGHSNECPFAVKFFKDQDEIHMDGQKFTPSSYPHGNMTYGHYLMVRNVTDADVGAYECRIFANCSRQEQITSQEVFIESWHTECTVTTSTENDRLENWQVGLIVALLVAALFVAILVVTVAVFVWRLKTLSMQLQKANDGSGV